METSQNLPFVLILVPVDEDVWGMMEIFDEDVLEMMKMFGG